MHSLKAKHPKRTTPTLSLPELLSGTFTVLCLVIFVYLKMYSLEMNNQETVSQLNTFTELSLIIAITFSITLATSMIFRKIFAEEMQ